MRSIDYFVLFSDNIMGKVRYYIKCNEFLYALVENFITVEKLNHLEEVEPTNSLSVIKIENMKEELVYMEIGRKKIV